EMNGRAIDCSTRRDGGPVPPWRSKTRPRGPWPPRMMWQIRPQAEATFERTNAKISEHRLSLLSPAVAWFCAASLAGNLAAIDSKAAVQESIHHRPVRHLDGYRDPAWLAGDRHQPL